MKRTAALLMAFIASGAQAGFTHTDWRYSGDEDAVLHEETGIEWLSMNSSKGLTFADVDNQMQDGYYFDGWRYATTSEVDSMITSFFDDAMSVYLNTGDDTSMKAKATEFISMFDATTYLSRGDHKQSFGVTLGDDGYAYRAGVGRYLSSYATVPWEVNLLSLEEDTDVPNYEANNSGFFLVSDGGVTLSSQLNPMLNINNPNAPVNASAAAVPVLGTGVIGLAFALFRIRGRNC